MTTPQRVVLVVGLVVWLWCAGRVLVPFVGDEREPCRPAAFEAVRRYQDIPKRDFELTEKSDEWQAWAARRHGHNRHLDDCRTPARRRVETASTVAVLAGIGTAAAVRILRDEPRLGVEP